ncbi:nuclear valosin-containing protein-like [Tropilaelaps mercedesae]|uniref:Nuclear valosin-containing protein-like n=1 Tax=Tropilaelaps mercedesae TaxID=418985 RepID=A0A1V9WYD0_9ACAR|nr:nuclear valosin-containing protein-like [Tropilaelaps mercedesae]
MLGATAQASPMAVSLEHVRVSAFSHGGYREPTVFDLAVGGPGSDGWETSDVMIDPVLMRRCKTILAESGGRILDADDLTDALRRKHPEYDRRKRAVFKVLISEYFRVLDVDEEIAEVNRTEDNVANRSLANLYSSAAPKQTSDVLVLKPPGLKKRPAEGQADVDNEVEQTIKRKKAGKVEKEVQLTYPTMKLSDVGGMEDKLLEVVNLLMHMTHPELYRHLGVLPPRGFLLHGPPGCGKTMLAGAIAGELGLPLLKVAAPEIIAGVSGESEQRIRDLFEQAVAAAPCVFFIDEIDAVTPKRETAQREMERRIVAQLLACVDDLSSRELPKEVLLIGATNRPDSLDPALRRAGRFDREIALGIPSETSRSCILRVLCKTLRLEGDFDFDRVAHLTPGFVGADLTALTREATVLAVRRLIRSIEAKQMPKEPADIAEPVQDNEPQGIRQKQSDTLAMLLKQSLSTLKANWTLSEAELDSLRILESDFVEAIGLVQPSAKREGFATVPNVTWADVGAMTDIRETLQVHIMAAVKHREQYDALGLNTSTGILMHGPPGCGKTLIAKAIANESGINFISVKGPELLNMYVGESERAIRQVFQRARASAPCVIFFDELDALCPRRSDGADGGGPTSRVVNQLLTEMDGLEPRKQVFVLAATNRPDIIDPAMLRPGRLDHIIHIGLPSRGDRVDILRALTKNATKPPISGVTLDELADRTDKFSGAELAALVKTASINALTEQFLKEDPNGKVVLGNEHFDGALEKLMKSKNRKGKQAAANMPLGTAYEQCI